MHKNWAEWLKSINKDKKARIHLSKVSNTILKLADIKPTDHLLDIGTGLGLLGFKAYEKLKTKGKVVAIDIDPNCVIECQKYLEENKIYTNYELHNIDLTNNSLPSKSFDVAVSRSVIMHILDKQKAISEIYRLLRNDGRLSLFEPTFYLKTERLCNFINPSNITNFKKIKEIEEKFRNDPNDPVTNYDVKSLKSIIKNSGFSDVKIFSSSYYDYWRWTKDNIDNIDEYISRVCFPLHTSTREKFLKYLSEDEFNIFLQELKTELVNKYFYQKAVLNYIIALKNPSIFSRLNFLLVGIIYGTIFGFSNLITNVQFFTKWFYLSRK